MASPSDASSSRARDPRPRSAVSAGVGLAGLFCLLLWTAAARAFEMTGPLAALTALLACGVPMVLWSLLIDKVHRNPSTGIDWSSPPRPVKEVLDISVVKLAGLWGIWGVIACLYCVGRWYWAPPYLFTMQLFMVAAVPLLLVSVPYVIWLDRRLKEPRDGSWHFGCWLIGRTSEVDRELMFDFFRSWAIKAFFLAFMLAIFPGNWERAIAPSVEQILASPARLTLWLIAVMFMIDVALACVGYALTLKPLDAHIRSANPYAAAWMAALLCYPPFQIMDDALNYHAGTAGHDAWIHWTEGWTFFQAAFGAWLVFLTGMYAWATVAFGMRFSNLTHRGILTHGPYAWSKHPAYVSKNLFWWCSVLPFFAVTGNYVDMIRNTVLLGFVSAIYYWRAKTEEKHLSEDPAYREYAAWMNRHGPFPRFVRWLIGAPKPPAVAAPAPAE